jgi:uncharacterized protein YllA (UPF0747 family)
MKELVRGNPELFKFPRLYLDYLAGKLPTDLSVPGLLRLDAVAPAGAADGSAPLRREFWDAVAEYDSRLGAGETTVRNIQALRAGKAVPIVTGQQPGLFGGPLYTVYKTMTAVALSEHLRKAEGIEAVPVLWNAGDDADFLEVCSAGFFTDDLEKKKFSVSEKGHSPGTMVGSLSIESIRQAADELSRQFADACVGTGASGPANAGPGCAVYAGAAYVRWLIENSLTRAADWGEFFSSLFLALLSYHGVVLVDARDAASTPLACSMFSAYLRNAPLVEERVLQGLNGIQQLGYEDPVSSRSAESCVFAREGDVRRKPSRDEFPRLLTQLEKGDASLLPNVLLSPVLREWLMAPMAQVLGPSEMSYSLVSRIVYDALGVEQSPVFPRLSLTILPQAIWSLLDGDESAAADVVLSFDRRLHDHLDKSLSQDVKTDLEKAEREVRSGVDKLKGLSSSAGRGAEDVAASASRKIDFELKRIREEFISAARKRALSANPKLRAGAEFLLPNGKLQERGFCTLAPLVHAGEPLLTDLKELAAVQVADCLEGRFYHYILVSDAL